MSSTISTPWEPWMDGLLRCAHWTGTMWELHYDGLPAVRAWFDANIGAVPGDALRMAREHIAALPPGGS